LPLLLRL